MNLAMPIYMAVERVEKRHQMNLQMGLTSGGDFELNELILKRLEKLGKLGLIDHYSRHFYVVARMPMCLLSEEIPPMRNCRDVYPGMKPYLIGCTEWNSNSMHNSTVDKPWNASMAVKAVILMLDKGNQVVLKLELPSPGISFVELK